MPDYNDNHTTISSEEITGLEDRCQVYNDKIDVLHLMQCISEWTSNHISNNSLHESYYIPTFRGKLNAIKHALCDKNIDFVTLIKEDSTNIYTAVFGKTSALYISKWAETIKHIEYHELKKNTMRVTDQFTCNKCKKNRVFVYEKQTRGADEPTTIFFVCQNCGKQWSK